MTAGMARTMNMHTPVAPLAPQRLTSMFLGMVPRSWRIRRAWWDSPWG